MTLGSLFHFELVDFLRKRLTIAAWAYFWSSHSISLISASAGVLMQCCVSCCGMVELEVKHVMVPALLLHSVIWAS